jgi:hypothetical protein
MSAVQPVSRGGGSSWQLILADLALILFLVTLTALPLTEPDVRRSLAGRVASPPAPRPEIAAAQALYRPVAGGPGLGEWLASQPRDPRATLTVFARYPAGGEAAAWTAARKLAAEARDSSVPVRTIITAGTEADLYASLAYDEMAGAGAGR